MSYILDALRRADADRERERGAVPGLHARPMASSTTEARPAQPLALWLALGAAVMALLAVLSWLALRGAAPASPATTVAPIAPIAPIAVVPPPVQPAPVMPQPAAPRPQAAILPGSPPAPPVMAQPSPVPSPLPSALPRAQPPRQDTPATAKAPVYPNPAPRPASAPAQDATPAAARAIALADLPPELRREMPAMSVGGSIYSDSAANRFVIINGQVVREGEAAAAGVTVERIGPKTAVLRWRELRIEVPL
jgi:general secretion pathway protein B